MSQQRNSNAGGGGLLRTTSFRQPRQSFAQRQSVEQRNSNASGGSFRHSRQSVEELVHERLSYAVDTQVSFAEAIKLLIAEQEVTCIDAHAQTDARTHVRTRARARTHAHYIHGMYAYADMHYPPGMYALCAHVCVRACVCVCVCVCVSV